MRRWLVVPLALVLLAPGAAAGTYDGLKELGDETAAWADRVSPDSPWTAVERGPTWDPQAPLVHTYECMQSEPPVRNDRSRAEAPWEENNKIVEGFSRGSVGPALRPGWSFFGCALDPDTGLDFPDPQEAVDPDASTASTCESAGVCADVHPVSAPSGRDVQVGQRRTAFGDAVGPRPATPDGPSPGTLGLLLVAVPLLVAAVVLYRRLTREDILEHDLRSRIVELVRDEPGTSASDLAEALDIALNTALYHVRILAEADALVVLRVNGEVACFDPSVSDPVEKATLSMMRSPAKRRILEALRGEPASSLSDLARRVDRAPSTVREHADALVERGVVSEHRSGGRIRLQLSDGARVALEGSKRAP